MKRVPWVGRERPRGSTAAVLLVTAGLAGSCAGGEGPAATAAAANPFEHCRARGIETDSAEFKECVDTYILERCSAAGEPESDAHARCVRELRDAAFVRDQLQIRGF